MPTWLSVIFEILKFSIPALIMFWAVQSLFGKFLAGQTQLKQLDIQKNQQDATLPLRLQAYERLSLFCERISIPNLMQRLRTEEMQAGALRYAMLMAIQQEYEHNITQQVYVSSQLWEIISIAKNDTINLISGIAETVDPKANAKELSSALINALNERNDVPLNMALQAIKKEAGLLFG